MSITKAERLAAIHDKACKAFDLAYCPNQDTRLACLSDRRFVYIEGAQWEGNLQNQFENRPRFEVNKILDSLMRIFNEYRNNRVTVDFRAKDDAASDETADVLNGLYRADEQESNADEAYDNAFDEGTAGGFGAWRLRAKYEDETSEDDERQRICMEPIYDADTSVFFDADAKRQDKSDATRCWVIYTMSHEAYKETYGYEVDPASFNKVENLARFDWYTPSVVYIAEYYEVSIKKRKFHFFRLAALPDEAPIKVADEDLDEEKLADLQAKGYIESRQKTIDKRFIHKYIMDGRQILEDCGVIAGEYIPIIPFYGKRMFIDNKERMFGHTRPMKDAQRIYNMEISSLAEQASQFGESIPILTPEQVAGFENDWADKNVKKPAYLLLHPMTDAQGQILPAGPIGYTQPPVIPPALQGLIQLAGQDLLELGGNQQQGDEIVSNISAKAVELVQSRLDMKTFIYMDNFKKAMRQSGVVWRSMTRALYDEEGRKMKTVNRDGTEDEVTLKEPVTQDGQTVVTNDLTSGRYDVVVDVGPSFVTKRDKTVRALLGILQFIEDPQMKAAVVGMIMQNVDGEGMDDLRAFARKGLVAAGVIKPTEEEEKQLEEAKAQQQPSAQDKFLLASAAETESKIALNQANADKAMAQAQEMLTASAKNEADAAHTLAEIQAAMGQLLAVVGALSQPTQQPAPQPQIAPPAQPEPPPPAL